MHLPPPSQIIDWFEEYAEEFFETHTELGESLDIAEALVTEIQQFETSTQVGTDICIHIFLRQACFRGEGGGGGGGGELVNF